MLPGEVLKRSDDKKYQVVLYAGPIHCILAYLDINEANPELPMVNWDSEVHALRVNMDSALADGSFKYTGLFYDIDNL